MAQRQLIDFGAQDRLAFLAGVQEGFDRACLACGGTIDRAYNIGGHSVRLQFAGEAMRPYIEPALAHLHIEPGREPDLTIGFFDSKSTGARFPLLVDSLIQFLRYDWWERLDHRREIKGYNDERIRAVFHLGPDILCVLDTLTNKAVYWVEDARQIPYYEAGYPLTTIINWWLAEQGQYYVHGAALGTAEGGVLLPGKGGSGKSTTTLACLDSTLNIVGDDYCIVGGSEFNQAYSIYNTVKLKGEEDLQRFPHLRPLVSNPDRPDDEKAMIFLGEHFPHKMMAEMPLLAILLPQVAHRPFTQIKPTSRARALKALAPSTIFQLAGNGHEAFQAAVQLVRTLPTFVIELGSDISAIPDVIESFLAEIAIVKN